MRKGDPLEQALEVCHLLDFFFLAQFTANFNCYVLRRKATRFCLVLRMYIGTQDFIINVFVSLVCTGFYNKDLPFQN